MTISSPTNAFTILGTEITTEVAITVDDEKRESGMYVCGVQGTGKSSFLESLVYQDISKGYGVILIDPHGDLIDHIITQLPEERVKDTYVLDIEDVKHPFGINLFSTHSQAGHLTISKAADKIIHVFERLFPVASRMLLEEYLENIALVFLENPGHTMLDIPRYLTDEVFRESLTRNLKNTYLRDYWQRYSTLSSSKQLEETASLRRRLNNFLNKPVITHIVGQKHSTLDFRSAMQHHEIILIRLPIKTLGEMATLIGTMLVALIHSATFSFENKPRSERPGFSFYVDEFQNFSTFDFADLFTQARKYKARQIVANQYTKQLDLEQMQEAVTTAHTLIAFRTTEDDSKKLAPLFSTLDLQKGKPVTIYRDNIFKRLLSHPNMQVREWAYSFIGSLEEASKQRITTETEKEYGKYGDVQRKYDVLPEYNFGAGIVTYTPQVVKELLQHLDTLLYETMRDKNVSEKNRLRVISLIAPLMRFDDYYTLAYVKNFEGKVSFEEWLDAKKNADTEERIKTIAISNHEKIHTRFVTRLAAVLAALIKEPLAQETQTTQTDIAHALSHLENFTAIARIGAETYYIRPTPIPTSVVSGPALWERKRRIQKQTWDKYCRDSDEVEVARKQIIVVTKPDDENDIVDEVPIEPPKKKRSRYEEVEE